MRLSIALRWAFGFLAASFVGSPFNINSAARFQAAVVRNKEHDASALEELNRVLCLQCHSAEEFLESATRPLILRELELPPSKYLVHFQDRDLSGGDHVWYPIIYRSVQESPERSVLRPSGLPPEDATFNVPDDVLKRILRDLLADSFAVFKTFRLVSKRWRNLAYDAMGENLMDLPDDQYVHVAQRLLSANVRLRATQTLLRRWLKKLEQTPPEQPDAGSQRKAKLINALITKHPLLDVWVDGAASSAAKRHLGFTSSGAREERFGEMVKRACGSSAIASVVLAQLWGILIAAPVFLWEGKVAGSVPGPFWYHFLLSILSVEILFMLLLPRSLGGAQVIQELRDIGSSHPFAYGAVSSVAWGCFTFTIMYVLTLALYYVTDPRNLL